MWRVLENDINQNIYITMKKRIFTTLLVLVAIALTTNTQAKETYAVLSSNGETLTKLDAIYGNPDYDDFTAVIPIDAIHFPDTKFRNWLLSQEYGQDGVLTREEIEGTYNFNLYNMNIADLTGVEYFTELTYLYCPNNQLTTIDVSMNVKLRDLFCNDNQLTTLNVSNNPDLEHIYCYNNQLTTLDVSSCTSLKRLYCYDNPIRGAGMDNLIEKLPQRDWNDGELYVYDVNSTNVSAICTPKHVAAAGQKGWMVYYQNSEYHWELYEGFAAIMGDTNGDGSVNIDDAIAVTNYLLGQPETNFNLTVADVNGDSQVSIADVTAIINQLLLDVIKDRLQQDLKVCRATLAQCRDDLERKDSEHEHSDLWSELERLETAVDNLATAVENATTKNELTSCKTDLDSILSDLAQLETNIMMAFL